MNVGVLVVCCLLATSVTGNDDERQEFDFDLEMSFEAEEINGPVDSTLAAVTTTSVTTKPGALKSPTAESVPVPEPVPVPYPNLAKANQSTNAKLDMKRKTPYSFENAVEDSKSGLDYGHKESSDGEVVTGTYYVLLPDGRKETVKYKADGNGYVADVSYEGEAKNDNAQSQKAAGNSASSGTSAQLQAYSNSSASMVSTLNTSTQPPQISSSMSNVSNVTTKGPSLLPSTSAAGTSSAVKASVVSTASVVSSISSIVSATATITTPSPFASSTLTLTPSSILTSTTPTTIVTAATTTPSSATIAPTNATNATQIINGTTTPTSNTPNNGTTTQTTATNNSFTTSATTRPTPVNATTTPTTNTTSTTANTTSAANSTSINGATIPINDTTTAPTTPINNKNTTPTIPTNNTTTIPTSPINTTSSTSNPAVIATSTTTSLTSTTTSSSVPKSTLNSTISPVSVTVSASLSLSNQNSTSVSLPQLSQTNKTQVTTATPASSSGTRSPDISLTLNMVSQAPGTPSPSENQSFFQALAGFIRSAGPTFIYCRNLLTSCSDSTRSPQASFCSNCNSLQKICSKSESIRETPPIYNDTLQAFQTLVPAAPIWPANKSPVGELVQKVGDSSSSEKPPNSNSTLPPATPFPSSTQVPQPSSLPNKIVSLEVPQGLADIVQSADTHFSYCQKIRSFCPRLESTRPYWESSSETPSKQKEFLLSTIQACSYCRSLWPICSEMLVESSEFLLDPSQLFTLHGLEEDVRNAMFTISYCRNSTQDCNQLLKSDQSTTVSPIQSMAPKTANNGTSPALSSSKLLRVTVDDKPIPGSSVPSQIQEPQNKDLGDLKFSKYCSRMTPVCSQLLSV